MKVIWSPQAKNLRREIVLYIAQYDSDAALRLLNIMEDAAQKIARFPNIGLPGRVAGTRELTIHKHYFIVYELSGQAIIILAIWHTSRLYPPLA